MDSSRVAGCSSVVLIVALAIPTFAHAECAALWKTARDAQPISTLVFSGTVIKEGAAYLVFASAMSKLVRTDDAQDTPVFEISVCSGTRLLSESQELVNQLGRGKPPRP
jgi:hypothetical protein